MNNLEQAYINGFCKAAEACGHNPQDLLEKKAQRLLANALRTLKGGRRFSGVSSRLARRALGGGALSVARRLAPGGGLVGMVGMATKPLVPGRALGGGALSAAKRVGLGGMLGGGLLKRLGIGGALGAAAGYLTTRNNSNQEQSAQPAQQAQPAQPAQPTQAQQPVQPAQPAQQQYEQMINRGRAYNF